MPLTQGKLWQSDLYWAAERKDRMRWEGRVLFTRCLSSDEGMCSKNTATLHQLGVLLLSLSPSFPPNQPILKIESIYHHLTPLQTTCLDTFQVLFWHSWVAWCSQIVQLFYFFTTVSHHSTLINQNPSMLLSAFSMLLTSFDEGYSPPLNLLHFILDYWGYGHRKELCQQWISPSETVKCFKNKGYKETVAVRYEKTFATDAF